MRDFRDAIVVVLLLVAGILAAGQLWLEGAVCAGLAVAFWLRARQT